eukprot:1150620-Pelagomonas_calceolata.AAC.2
MACMALGTCPPAAAAGRASPTQQKILQTAPLPGPLPITTTTTTTLTTPSPHDPPEQLLAYSFCAGGCLTSSDGHFIRGTFWGVRGARARVQKIIPRTSILAWKSWNLSERHGVCHLGSRLLWGKRSASQGCILHRSDKTSSPTVPSSSRFGELIERAFACRWEGWGGGSMCPPATPTPSTLHHDSLSEAVCEGHS